MKFQRQLILDHNPAEGRYGDCYRTCIAILLGIDAVEVPHFVEYDILDSMNKGLRPETENNTLGLTREWLQARGYTMIHINCEANTPKESWDLWTAGMPFILTCKGLLSGAHAVIAQGGPNCIWCPTTGGPVATVQPWRCLDSSIECWSIDLIVKLPEFA